MSNAFKIILPNDFEEKANRKILLTGAGFSKDFGGFLAKEVALELFNRDIFTPQEKLLIIRSEFDYESFCENIDNNDDKKKFNNALINIFEVFDKHIINGVKLITEQNRFFDMFRDKEKYNFIISLNQDLVIERYFLERGKRDQPSDKSPNDYTKKLAIDSLLLRFPYSDYCLGTVVTPEEPGNYAIQSQEGYSFNKFKQVIKYEPEKLPEAGRMNYVKLHGSANWQHSEDLDLMITGFNKSKKISRFKALKANNMLFNELCTLENLRIVIVGYGFGDEHINTELFYAITRGAKLFIIDTRSPQCFVKSDIYVGSPQKEMTTQIPSGHDKFISQKFIEFLDHKDISNFNLLQEFLK